jgi:prepilin-type N-terminal cleavage/methylation domain-containing protein
MTLKQTKSRGFTIVELLIVIVVIAILAAITMVAYNGVQNRAKASAAQSAASIVMKKAEAANAAGTTAGYPTAVAGFASSNAAEADLAGSGVVLAAISAAPSNPNTVEYLACTTPAGIGARVGYWDYSAAIPVKVQKTIGGTCTTYSTTALTGSY